MNEEVSTAKDAKLFEGVSTVNPPQHAKLIPGWAPPGPPEGYRNLVAILVPVQNEDGSAGRVWELDYLDTETGVFASEEHELNVSWPWQPGYKPTPQDWDSIGIPHLK